MPRPCVCNRASCGLCELYRHSPRHRAAWGGASVDGAVAIAAPEGDAVASLPPTRNARANCASLGETIRGEEASRLGLSVLRGWRPCEKGHGVKGHVCGCEPWPKGGCAGCPDWTPAGD